MIRWSSSRIAMVDAACKKPRARSVNFSRSIGMSLSGDQPAPAPLGGSRLKLCHPRWESATARQEDLRHAHRIPVPLPCEGVVRRGAGNRRGPGGTRYPRDRAFALAQGDAAFDPANPAWLPKQNFMCRQANARTALLQCLFKPRSGRLNITGPTGSGVSANALTPAGREELGRFLADYRPGGPRHAPLPPRSGPRLLRLPPSVVSLINLASLRDLESRVGARRHRRRFRANVWFTGTPAGANSAGSAGNSARRRRAARAEAHPPMRGD